MEGLSAEREALWARIDKVSFLTVDEKRAAVGYSALARLRHDPAPREELAPAPAPEPVFGGEDGSFSGAGDSPAGSRPPAHALLEARGLARGSLLRQPTRTSWRSHALHGRRVGWRVQNEDAWV